MKVSAGAPRDEMRQDGVWRQARAAHLSSVILSIARITTGMRLTEKTKEEMKKTGPCFPTSPDFEMSSTFSQCANIQANRDHHFVHFVAWQLAQLLS